MTLRYRTVQSAQAVDDHGRGAVWDRRTGCVEADICGKPPHERQLVRQQQSCSLLDNFDCWLRATLEKLSHKLDTAAAIQYALPLWPARLRYCYDGYATYWPASPIIRPTRSTTFYSLDAANCEEEIH